MEKAVGGEMQGFPKGNWERGFIPTGSWCVHGTTISREDLKGKMAECFPCCDKWFGFHPITEGVIEGFWTELY